MSLTNKTKLARKICEVCQCGEKYCLLKEIILSSHDDNYIRMLCQLKCLEIYKWDESKRLNKEVTWDDAHLNWVAKGYAKNFSELYDEDIKAEKLYAKIIKN